MVFLLVSKTEKGLRAPASELRSREYFALPLGIPGSGQSPHRPKQKLSLLPIYLLSVVCCLEEKQVASDVKDRIVCL